MPGHPGNYTTCPECMGEGVEASDGSTCVTCGGEGVIDIAADEDGEMLSYLSRSKARYEGKAIKIRLGDLRQLIREVSLSPSLRNNKPLNGPFDSKNVQELSQKLRAAFGNALKLDMTLRKMGESNDVPDDEYQHIEDTVAGLQEKFEALLQHVLESLWKETGSQPTKTSRKPAAPASQEQPVDRRGAEAEPRIHPNRRQSDKNPATRTA